ncbi:conserved hypothetical protein [Anaeromyxobacter dehalogenans 2CP-1]|uniref:Collagen triple helix repeat protein n=1 Tax=Anaeromyxobacter dehalogenans (strain ATCC BAA-258 / DSM 21875 / 2CP-1) TaxID=455488 RepID=B8JAA5_ANAD2|nr:conserved hypothetical protein [Anaeromyxobacter dehalogenans 2CP-1]
MGGHGGDGGAGGRRASLSLKDGRSAQLSGGFDGPMGPNGAAGPDGRSGSDGPAGLGRIEPAAAASLD